ncbi:MAG: hypothetical protein KAR38_07360, partial [Calditrichia bacterium]|nr:hypothetical protein [Calditrichia bacterium]
MKKDNMKTVCSKNFLYLILLHLLMIISTVSAQHFTWAKIDSGLFYAEFKTEKNKSAVGDSKITVIKIDPELYTFK